MILCLIFLIYSVETNTKCLRALPSNCSLRNYRADLEEREGERERERERENVGAKYLC